MRRASLHRIALLQEQQASQLPMTAYHRDPDILSPSATATCRPALCSAGFRGPVLSPINCLLLGLLEGKNEGQIVVGFA